LCGICFNIIENGGVEQSAETKQAIAEGFLERFRDTLAEYLQVN